MLSPLLQKLQETVDNPGLYRPLTVEEQAELFLLLFAPKPKLFEKPKVIKGIDGATPVKDNPAALEIINQNIKKASKLIPASEDI